VVCGRRNRKQAQGVRAQHGAAKALRKSRMSGAHKGKTLALVAEMKKPEVDRRTSAALCAGFSALHNLSPNSELKPASAKDAVRAGKAGEPRRWRCSQRRRPADNARPPTR
jgi:hypothetical protein